MPSFPHLDKDVCLFFQGAPVTEIAYDAASLRLYVALVTHPTYVFEMVAVEIANSFLQMLGRDYPASCSGAARCLAVAIPSSHSPSPTICDIEGKIPYSSAMSTLWSDSWATPERQAA